MRKNSNKSNLNMENQYFLNPYQTKWTQRQSIQSEKNHTVPDYHDDNDRSESSSRQKLKLMANTSYGGGIASARSYKTSSRSAQNNIGTPKIFLSRDTQSRIKSENFQSPMNCTGFSTSPISNINKAITEFTKNIKQKPWEDYLDQVRNAITIEQLIFDDQFLHKLKYSINQAFSHIKLLEETERITKKEIQKLQKINEFLTISTNNKDAIYKEAVKENIQIKQQLRNVTEALRKKEDKFIQIQQKFGNINDINDFNTIQNPNSKKAEKKPDVFKQPRTIQNQQQSQSILDGEETPLSNLNDQKLQRQLTDIKQKHMNRAQSILIFEPQHEKKEQDKEQEKEPISQIFSVGFGQKLDEQGLKIEDIKSMNDENNNLLYLYQQANPYVKSRKQSNVSNFTHQENYDDDDDEDLIQKTRFHFVQHSTDFYFFTLLLDLNISDNQIMQYYTQHKNVSFIQEQMSLPDKLLNLLSNLNKENFQMMFDSIKYQQQIAEIAVKVIIKLKKIIQVVSNINSQILVPDAFEVIVNETCRIIDCDRSSVFLTDYDRQELWTKVAKGTNTIRVSLNKGLVGHVATKGETLNILDAHKDYRFNRDIDKKTNYKTKSVLCVPIFDRDRVNIVGVLQAINKNNQSFFSKDDEGLIHIMATVAQQLLRNSMFNDQNQSFQQNLRSLLSIGFKLNRFKSIEELIPQAEYLLSKTFDIPECRIYLYSEKTNKLVRYISNTELQEYDINIGLVGESFTQGFSVSVSNAYSHNRFNNLIDINTSMPVSCLPIYAVKSTTSKFKIGVITVINQKGIEGISYRMNSTAQNGESNKNVNSIKPGVASTFEETISTFGQIVSQIVVNIQKMNLDDY